MYRFNTPFTTPRVITDDYVDLAAPSADKAARPIAGPAKAATSTKDDSHEPSQASSSSSSELMNLYTTTTVSLPQSAAVARLAGRKTRSQKLNKGARERMFNSTGAPPNFSWSSKTDNKVFPVWQTVDLGSFASSTTVESNTAFAFKLSDAPKYANYVGIFDQYRIRTIEFWAVPRVTVVTPSASTKPALCASVVDYDDVVALSAVNDALDYQNVMYGPAVDGHYRLFHPHAAIAAYSGVFTSFANEESPWIDAASVGVLHYGVKMAWNATDIVYAFDCFARYHLEFRNTR
jgi:hypothetical protein